MIGEEDIDRLISLSHSFVTKQDETAVLKEAMSSLVDICSCDCGFLFIVNDDYLSLECCIVKSRNIEKSGTSAEAIFPLVYLPDARKQPVKSPVQISALNNELVNLDNVYLYPEINSTTLAFFDSKLEYSTRSLVSIPIVGRNNEVLAVVEFTNAYDDKGNIINFTQKHVDTINAVCANISLLLQIRQKSKQYSQLLESFIEVLAKAIDYKSPYTGVHCQRVPIITRMLTTAVIEDDSPAFDDFHLSEDDWYALHIASWLHDCGKVTTPEYILDKATKLETIYNRIHEIRNRFEILRRDAHIQYLQDVIDRKDTKENLEAIYQAKIAELEAEFEHVAQCNTGDTPLTPEDIEKLQEISKKTFIRYFSRLKGLSWAELNNLDDKNLYDNPAQEYLIQNRKDQKYGNFNIGELYNLGIVSGTINTEERQKINEHIVMTIDMLQSIPFPKELSHIVEYAGGHHERVDGKGYPNQLTGEQMSIPTKIMAIADIFEALTSVDRPYKVPKKLSHVLSIMQEMKNTGHIDPDIYEVFVKSKIYLIYAKQYLLEEQIDEFNDEAYL